MMYPLGRTRAQAIVIQTDRVLFGFHNSRPPHFFIGGGVEEGETPERAVLRELREEANVEGEIFFRFGREVFPRHVTFLVDIGVQSPKPGFDPEESQPSGSRPLFLEMIPLTQSGSFTDVDIAYFEILQAECKRKNMIFPWLNAMEGLIGQRRKE